jgi:uncharacterized protein with HEPN domain
VKEDRIYLEHIEECLNWIAQFAADGKPAFLRDRRTQSAVLRELQTMAESTQRLSQKLKDTHPEVPWQAIAGFRNVLVRAYLEMNLERVWTIVDQDLPPLRRAVDMMLHTE